MTWIVHSNKYGTRPEDDLWMFCHPEAGVHWDRDVVPLLVQMPENARMEMYFNASGHPYVVFRNWSIKPNGPCCCVRWRGSGWEPSTPRYTTLAQEFGHQSGSS